MKRIIRKEFVAFLCIWKGKEGSINGEQNILEVFNLLNFMVAFPIMGVTMITLLTLNICK